jgi:hypothetical protein
MRRIVFKNIEEFYDCVEKQMDSSSASNLDDQKVDQIYDDAIARMNTRCAMVKNYLSKNGREKSAMLPLVLNSLLEENCVSKITQLFDDRTLDECDLAYYRLSSTEHFVWACTLLIMSWTLRNLKAKVEEGSCYNQTHKRGDKDLLCPQGSKFHLDFYNECLQSFENVIEAAKLNPPKLVD